MKQRVNFILILFGVFGAILISRLYFLSIKSHTYYEKLANQNIIKSELYAAPRGEISDRSGKKIAINKLGFSLSIKPHLKKKHLDFLVEFIKLNIPDINTKKIYSNYQRANSPYNHKPIKVVDFIPYEDLISKLVHFYSKSEFVIKPSYKRFYPQGELLAHIVGYVSKANKEDINNSTVSKITGISGRSGIEKYYNSILEGTLGKIKKRVTALNKTIQIISNIKPKNSSISLSIDLRVQEYLDELFTGKSGAIIVMNVNDGSILAADSYPKFDNNLFVEGISKLRWQRMIKDLNHPFTNKFTSGLYPPGSSIKPEVLLSFLNSKLLNKNEKLLCKGEIRLGKRRFRCWNHYGHGEVNAKRAIKESCDVYFYKGGLRVGIDKISTDLSRYGFGKKTGIDLPNEFIGTLPSRNWKLLKYALGWNKGDTLNTVIGQGSFLVTPIQVAAQTALVATAKLPIPHFIKSINKKVVNFNSIDLLNKYEKSELNTIREGMFEVCNQKGGTAFKYNSAIIKIAGKTGTSQVVGIPQDEKERMSEDELKYFKKSHAWFTSFGPYQNPKYVVTILIEHGGHGGKAAGEIASNIYNKLVELGYIDKKYIGR